MKRILFLFFALLCTYSFSQTLQTVNGVHSIAFQLDNGSIYVYLPENIVEGQSFSGTVAIYPIGSSTREQSKNLQKLQSYKVNVLGREFTAGSKNFSLTAGENNAIVSLADSRNRQVANKPVQFNMRTALPNDTVLSLPSHIANSVNTSFYGVFDGNVQNTSVRANGKPINVVAESPVSICLRPENLASTTANIEITDGDKQQQGQCNSIYYTLRIGPTSLKRGQNTFFDATIHGVGSIEEDLTYTVVNNTTNIVRLDGGNSQTFTIKPGDGENGNWFHHFSINAINTGDFTLTTNLIVPDTPYPSTGTVGGEVSSANVDCRIFNQSFNISAEECAGLGGKVFDGNYEPTVTQTDEFMEASVVSVSVSQDSNEAQVTVNIESGDEPEMAISTCTPLDDETQTAVDFLTGKGSTYSFSHKNQDFGRPSASNIQTTLLYSNGSTQTINTQINFVGNPFFSIAESPDLTRIRGEKNRLNADLNNAKNNKKNLSGQRDRERTRYINARDEYRKNNGQYWYLHRIDQSLEKARPVFADSLKVLIDSLKSFQKRTGGLPSAANAKKIDDNLKKAKKAHEDCMAELRRLQQELKDLTNEKETLKNRQKQIHREIMDLFRSTGMNFAGTTRRDKNGVFHYQYGVVTVSGNGTASYHKGSLPVQILNEVLALEKEMKQVTDRLNAVTERLNALPGEIKAKQEECDKLAQKLKDAEDAKNAKDAIVAEDQYWNNEIDALCVKIIALLNRLKTWAAANDRSLLNLINNVKCGENIFTQIDGVINRKKILEAGFKGKADNFRRDMNNAGTKVTELDGKIETEEDNIRDAQNALAANQKAEAEAAAVALAADKEKCLKIMKELGYGATSIADVIDLYEISQDLKKAADEAKEAMDNLRKAVEFGEKHGLDPGDAKKWVENTQKRLSSISKRLAKLKKYKDLADKIQEYADRIGTLIGSDGTPTQNAAAFGEGLKFMNEALEALAERFPILKVFTAYFTFITEAYSTIIGGATDAVRKQYQMLLSNVRNKMKCDQLMRVCRKNGDDIEKIKEWAYNEYVVKPGFDALRRDQTQAKAIIAKLVEQRMAECCFERLQAIRGATQ